MDYNHLYMQTSTLPPPLNTQPNPSYGPTTPTPLYSSLSPISPTTPMPHPFLPNPSHTPNTGEGEEKREYAEIDK